MQKITLQVEGMTCTSCALGIVKTLENIGISEVKGNYATGEILFKAKDEKEIDLVVETIAVMGYQTSKPSENQDLQVSSDLSGHNLEMERKFWITLPFTAALMLHMVFPQSIFGNPLIQLALCLPVFFIGLDTFGRSAMSSINFGVPNMDVLIFSGSTAAFIYSLGCMVLFWNTSEIHKYLFFETSSSIVTLVLLGNAIEHRSTKKTTQAIKDLKSLQPSKALIIESLDGKEKIVEIKSSAIKKGRKVKINEGAQIPCDGIIISGEGSVDESYLTGESLAKNVQTGDKIFAGTLLLHGNVVAIAEKSYKDFSLNKIIELVKNAQLNPPKIQRLGDKISSWFVPLVMLLAGLSFVISFFVFQLELKIAVINSIAILVISCPCAMGLATPTAVMVGIGRAAKEGVLFRSGEVLEKYAHVELMVFDKTGTLTTGEMKISKVELLGHETHEQILAIASTLASASNHPISKAIRKEHKGITVELNSVYEIKGKGIEGVDPDGVYYQMGASHFIGVTTEDSIHPIIYLSKNKQLIAKIHLEDPLRKGMKELIQFFHDRGIKTMLLSGDKESVAKEIGIQTGIQEVLSGKTPEEKQAIVSQLTKEYTVGMVGDGINDAAALASAHLGISHGEASSIAINTAGIIITNEDFPEKLKVSLELSKATLSTIRQNLFWAFSYNIVAIPMAGLGYLNPMIGAVSMAFSDLMVIGNSLRLSRRKIS